MLNNNQENMLWSLKETQSTTKQGKIQKREAKIKKKASEVRRNVNDLTSSMSTGFFCYQGKKEDVRNSNALWVQPDMGKQCAEGKTCLHAERICTFEIVASKIIWK